MEALILDLIEHYGPTSYQHHQEDMQILTDCRNTLDSALLYSSSRLQELNFQMKCKFYFLFPFKVLEWTLIKNYLQKFL